MPYDYDNIVHRWYEELKLPFINYIRASFTISYDEAMDLYTDTWLEVRKIIIENRATNDKWKALIFTIGKRQAAKIATRCRPRHVSISGDEDDSEEVFNRGLFEAEKAAQRLEAKSVYEDPELQAVLGAELSYIPDPCNKILKLYYFDEMSMTEIADAMNYGSSRSAITTKNRCMDKLKERVKKAVRRLGIID